METDNSIFFWKENNKYGYLSNFYISSFCDKNNVRYICNEQYFMAKKCMLFNSSNKSLYSNIMKTCLPYTIKKYGRQVENFDKLLWDKEKYEIKYCILSNIKLNIFRVYVLLQVLLCWICLSQ